MVESVRDRIHAISLTSGVLTSIEEEESYVLDVVKHLTSYNLPIGVSLYPTPSTPDRLRELGIVEVKFNLEAATPELFSRMCPGLDYDLLWQVLDRSVHLFAKNHVFSNVIIGLGETDEEVLVAFGDLRRVGCDILTLGQYLQPTSHHLPVARWWTPGRIPCRARKETRWRSSPDSTARLPWITKRR